MLRHSTNMTNESISLGIFDKKTKFHFCVISSLNISELDRRGKIIEIYLCHNNFLLLPRNENEGTTPNGETFVEYTDLLIMWETPEMNWEKIVGALRKLSEVETNVHFQSNIFLDNGAGIAEINRNSIGNDFSGSYSYIISHRFVDSKYYYRITTSDSFRHALIELSKERLEDNTVLDLVFTGKCSNRYNNCYNFSSFKVKDVQIMTNDAIVLSNARGLVRWKNEYPTPGQVILLNYLSDWKCPKDTMLDYYSGMNLKTINFISEQYVSIKPNGKVLYKGEPINRPNMSPLLILAEDEKLRDEVMKQYFRSNQNAANEIWASQFVDMKMVLENFNEATLKQVRKEFCKKKEQLVGELRQAHRQLREVQGDVLRVENMTKDFIPIPRIVLPQTDSGERVYDVYSLLKVKNGEYIIEGEAQK